MAVGSIPPAPNENDLNGLVDGLLDTRRQAEVLQRLKSQIAEAAQVAAWREQNDLLKATFSEVESEPMPLSLRLLPPRLRCVGDPLNPLATPSPALPPIAIEGHGRRGLLASGVLLGFIAVASSWLVVTHGHWRRPAPLVLTAAEDSDGLLTTASFNLPKAAARPVEAARPADAEQRPRELLRDLPSSRIPDLSQAGFSFTEAVVHATEPPMLVFSYRDRAGTLLSLQVSRLSLQVSRGPARASEETHSDHAVRSVSWRSPGKEYRLSAALEPERLGAIARFLQASRDDEAGVHP